MKLRLTVILFILVMFSGCTQYYYVPNIQNVPLFKEKDEYRLTIATGAGDESTCTEVQTALSVTDKIGVMVNFMTAKGENSSNENSANGNFLEAAVGYYKPVEKAGVFEVYGGIGGSNQHHHYSDSGTSDLSSLRFFVQPSYGFTFDPVDIAFSTRLSALSFVNTDNYVLRNTVLYDKVNSLSHQTHLLLEPALTIRAGWKNVKLQLQFLYVGYLNSKGLNIGEETHLSLGLNVAIAKRYRKIITE